MPATYYLLRPRFIALVAIAALALAAATGALGTLTGESDTPGRHANPFWIGAAVQTPQVDDGESAAR